MYFATEQNSDKVDGALWCLWPKELNSKAGINSELVADLPFFEVDDFVDHYLPSRVAAGTMQDLEPIAAGAQRRFARLHSQLGVFTISHKSKQEIVAGPHLAKITIPAANKGPIRKQLSLLGVTQLSMFPELESVGRLTCEIKI
jgi:hypothetical protein